MTSFKSSKKPSSTVPILPNVPNANNLTNNGFLNRPLSVENSQKTSASNFGNSYNMTNSNSSNNTHVNGKSTEFKTHLNSNSQFSIESNSSSSKKVKNFLSDKQTNSSSNSNNNNNNTANEEDFGLSVTKIESRQDEVNKNSNQSSQSVKNNASVSKRKTGQIIDFRSMINEATKLNFEEGSHDNSVQTSFFLSDFLLLRKK